ncbi:MAG: hypothetical protein QXT84_03060 [Candidatus Bathyarchaeia archaeon]
MDIVEILMDSLGKVFPEQLKIAYSAFMDDFQGGDKVINEGKSKHQIFWWFLIIIIISSDIAYAKRGLIRGPEELFLWLPQGFSPLASAILSICLGLEGGVIVALVLIMKGYPLRDWAKSLILSSLFSSLPGVGYLIALCLGAYHEGHTSSPFLFDFLVNYYPPALVLGMLGAFLRTFYAFRSGLGLPKSISMGIFYWLFTFFILFLTSYMWRAMELLENLGNFAYAFIGMFVGVLHIIYRFRQTFDIPQALREGIGLWALVWIVMAVAFYQEKPLVVADTYSAWRSMQVPLCTLLLFFFVSQIHLNPRLFSKD